LTSIGTVNFSLGCRNFRLSDSNAGHLGHKRGTVAEQSVNCNQIHSQGRLPVQFSYGDEVLPGSTWWWWHDSLPLPECHCQNATASGQSDAARMMLATTATARMPQHPARMMLATALSNQNTMHGMHVHRTLVNDAVA
jgi:hypothetical protein